MTDTPHNPTPYDTLSASAHEATSPDDDGADSPRAETQIKTQPEPPTLETLQAPTPLKLSLFDHVSVWYQGLNKWADKILDQRQDTNIREALEEIIEDDDGTPDDEQSVSAEERSLISNILQLRNNEVEDVMIPRADVTALDVNTSHAELLAFMSDLQFSRIPVYRESLDDVLGTVHIKDILGVMAQNKEVRIQELVRSVTIVSPSMPVLDLLLHMRESRKHMAMVVDEYGGIDGLVTIGDVIESIVGELDDEHDDLDDQPQLVEKEDGSILADARVDLDDFEARYGFMLDEDDHAESDTLGGLVFAIAGRVPVRGEMLKHKSGMEFEVIEADPRRIHRLQIRNIPALPTGDA